MPGRILTAVDPDHPDPRTVEVAAALARAADAELTLLAVVGVTASDPVVALIADPEATDAAQLALEGVSAAAGDLDLELRTVQAASPAEAIHSIAEDEEFGVIVAGTGRHRRLGRLGSVASRLLHGSPCPVMVVPPRLFDAGHRFRRIGVAYVPTSDGLDALHAAAALARSLHASLELISVARAAGWTDASRAPGFVMTQQEMDRLHKARRETIRRAADRAAADVAGGLDVTILVEDGDPATVLADASRKLDLLVCGTRGHGPVTGLLLGAVSRRLVHEATCPVLVVPRGHEVLVEHLLGNKGATA